MAYASTLCYILGLPLHRIVVSISPIEIIVSLCLALCEHQKQHQSHDIEFRNALHWHSMGVIETWLKLSWDQSSNDTIRCIGLIICPIEYNHWRRHKSSEFSHCHSILHNLKIFSFFSHSNYLDQFSLAIEIQKKRKNFFTAHLSMLDHWKNHSFVSHKVWRIYSCYL